MIKIKGHSNYNVKIILINKKYYILKNSKNCNDNERLIKQMKKQQKFYEHLKLSNFKIPKLIKSYYKKNNIYYLMDYIYYAENIIDFIEKKNIYKINNITKNLINFIEHCISFCKYEKLNFNIINNKITSVIKNLENNKHIDIKNNKIIKTLEYLKINKLNICKKEIPVGICHGDLTLSNMLFDENTHNIYLIDFLDSFIDSPIVDIVKIRQDTKFYWTLQLYKNDCDKNKIKIIFNNIDKKIDLYFKKYKFYHDFYKFFEYLNILRILQYAHDKQIINYLLNCL